MRTVRFLFLAGSLVAFAAPTVANAQTAGHVTGLGGVFVTSKNPKALAAWYRDVLGIAMQAWGGATLRYDAPGHPPVMLWTAMPATSDELLPSKRDFMLDLAVDDLDAFVVKLQKHKVPILKRDDTDPFGKFAWIMDPDGTKIELWQPKRN